MIKFKHNQELPLRIDGPYCWSL